MNKDYLNDDHYENEDVYNNSTYEENENIEEEIIQPKNKKINKIKKELLIKQNENLMKELMGSELSYSQKKEMEKTIDEFEVMKIYNEGKLLKESVLDRLEGLYHLKKKEKLSKKHLEKKPKGIEESEFEELKHIFLLAEEKMQTARDLMVKKMELFIYYLVNTKFSTFRIHLNDLYQEGIIAILKSMDGYDPNKAKPTTFFYFYIIHEITGFINLHVNKTSSHYSTSIVKIKRVLAQFEKDNKIPTIKDIATVTGISAETITQAMVIMENSNEVSFESIDYMDFPTSTNSDSAEKEFMKEEDDRLINLAVEELDDVSATIIKMKYGLNGDLPVSYKAIATKLNLQIDRVKKLHTQALKTLKKSKIIKDNFNFNKNTDKYLDDGYVGIVPVNVGKEMMEEIIEEITNNPD